MMDFKGQSEKWARDRMPEGYFQKSQNVDRSKAGELKVRKGLADTTFTDSTNTKLSTIYFTDKRGNGYIVYAEGAALAATLEYKAITAPLWTT